MKKSLVLLTLIVLLSVLAACSMFRTASPPAPTIEPTVSPPAPAETRMETRVAAIPATQTPSPTARSTATTRPPLPTPTRTLTPTRTPPPTPTPGPRYVFQAGTPLGIANFVAPEAGCNWMGVGGQAFDMNSEAVASLVVEVGGSLNGAPVSRITLSGSTAVFGPGGYVVQIAAIPTASDGTLWIRLAGLDGKPLSDPLYFTTYSDCDRNLVLINFAEVATALSPRVFLPSVVKATAVP